MEEIKKIASDLGNRIKGTYGATFVLVWLVYNWRLVYIVMSFDKSYNLSHKLEVLNRYLAQDKGHCNAFWYPLGMSVLSIVGYYLMNYLTFAISGVFNLRLKPWIQNKIDKIKITVVPVETHNKLDKEYSELLKKIKLEKEIYLADKDELTDLKDKYIKIKHTYENEIEKYKSENLELNEFKTNNGFKAIQPSVILGGVWIKRKRNRRTNVVITEEIKTHNHTSYKDEKPYLIYPSFNMNNLRFLIIESEEIETKIRINTKLVYVNDNLYLGFETDSIETFEVEYERN